MKKLDIFNKRRRGFTSNHDGILGFGLGATILILLVADVIALWMLSQIIVPLIILIVAIIILSVVLKRVWGVPAPEAIGREVAAVGETAIPYAKKGVSWFTKLIGGK